MKTVRCLYCSPERLCPDCWRERLAVVAERLAVLASTIPLGR